MSETMIGAIEAGGTKMVLAVGRTWQEVRDAERYVIPTTTPEDTMNRVMNWFEQRHAETPLAAIGVASFGPIDFARRAIASSTPKLLWRDFSWAKTVAAHFDGLPLGLDTDTNAAALAEYRWGAGRGKEVVVYMTVGTGIGGGLVVGGRPVHGLLHPEFGHMVVRRRAGDDFAGTCPSHGDCLEGLACGVAIKQRWHRTGGPQLPGDHPAWELESDYLSDAVVNVTTITSCEVIILGGGVMAVPGLIERVRTKVHKQLNGYLDVLELTSDLDRYIIAPELGIASGVVGAFALGVDAALA
ncbi:MAG TPA: ROK family protein [Acidimicrobiales bacterium]|nr:ROK family protein [Acidimicrobiales bacterium]